MTHHAPTSLPFLALLPLAAAIVAAPGCAPSNNSNGPLSPSSDRPTAPGPGQDAWSTDPAALLPERIRIHPLTRVAEDTEGQRQLALHLELKDRYGHNIKSLGWLRVELSGASHEGVPDNVADGDEPADDGRAQDVYWEVDLRDPEQNALMYDDLISRTYLIYLGGLPGWVDRWAAGDASAAEDPWLTLSATFIAREPTGEDRVLRDTYRLER